MLCSSSKRTRTQLAHCREAPFYTLGPLTTDIAPAYIHTSPSARRIGWYGTAMLCYVTPKGHLGLPTSTTCAPGSRLSDRGSHRRSLQRTSLPIFCGCALSARFEFRWEDQFNLSLDPERAREYHDATLPRMRTSSRISVRCAGPQFCSMQITQALRERAGEGSGKGEGSGFAGTAREYRRGGELYRKA